jgi:hypothetical protein
VRDGDEECPDRDGYAGCYYITAKANEKFRPFMSNRANREITNPEDIRSLFYPGSYCVCLVNSYASAKMKKGVSVGLKGIQFFEDGENIGGRKIANAFESYDDTDEVPEQAATEDFM